MAKSKKSGDDSLLDSFPSDTPKKITKVEAMRQTLAAGIDVPAIAVKHIKDTYDIDIDNGHFSTFKSNEKKAGASGAVKIPSASGKVKIPAAKKLPAASTSKPDLADSVAAVKKLVDELGAEQVVKLVGLLK